MIYGVGWYKMHTVEHVEYEWRRWVMVAFQTFWSSLHSWFHSFDLGVSCLLSFTLHPINKNQTADWEGCMSLLITMISQSQNIPNLIRLSLEMDVSENSGTPKSSILIGFSITNHPFWDTPIFGNTQIHFQTSPSSLPSVAAARPWYLMIQAAWHRALCPEGHQLRGGARVGWV